ncbi:hypothetical protein S1001342_00720 [Acetobacter pasteurianus subsp. pasteurianus]|uniref:Uncharacterized protein n=1 Tax=Acetobacter pasteurianus subsp. pasteurianus TaxID=481145 RepID=A0A1Y0Y3P1_ACEPA|nr:hypothetical protein S1001342_00720 [Acetobacter pasteurianus subsp. pasteurianus]
MMRLAERSQVAGVEPLGRIFPHAFDVIDVQSVTRRSTSRHAAYWMQRQVLGTNLFPGRIVTALARCAALLIELLPALRFWLVPARPENWRSDRHVLLSSGHKKRPRSLLAARPLIMVSKKVYFGEFGEQKMQLGVIFFRDLGYCLVKPAFYGFVTLSQNTANLPPAIAMLP